MANVKISQLPPATSPLAGTEEMPVVQGGVTKRAAVNTIGFTQAGTGAVLQTAQSKLRQYVSPTDFGAVGDGVADDTVPIRNALQYCSDTGVPFRAFGGATYRIASAITINRTNGKPVVIDWGGAKVVASGAGIQFIGNGTAYLNTTLATEIDRDDPSINLTSVAGIAKGDLLEILSPALTGGTISTYHYYVVNEVIGNNVFIEGTTVADVKNQQIIDSGQTGSITVAAYRVAAPVTMENATFEIIDPTGVLSGLNFEWHSKINIKNIDFTGKCRQQLRVIFSGQLDVGGCTFRDFGYVEGNSGYVNLPSAPGGLSFGYGTLVSRVWETLFHDNTGLRGWHTVDFSRGSMKALVSDCSFNRNAFAVSTHEGAWYTEVRNCMFDGTGGITLVRGIYGVVQGCHFKGMNEHGIVYGGNMVDVRIADNKIEYNPGVVNLFSAVYYDVGGPSTPVAGAASTGFTRVFEMVGNTFVGRSRCYAGFNNSADGKTVVADNSFMGGVSLIALYAGKNTYVRNNSFSNIDQSAINLVLGSGNPEVVCNGNSQAGDMVTYSNSGLFYLTGSGTPLLHFENNSTETEYLIRFNSNLTVKSVVNCAGRASRLFLGTGTVTNAINNYYVVAVAFTTTVTNSVNNQPLV
jgi:hypothetical protein